MVSIAAWFSPGPPNASPVQLTFLVGCLGCVEPDWLDEMVLGDDLVGLEIEGRPNSGFGSALVLDSRGLFVGAEIEGTVQLFDATGESAWCYQMIPGVGFELGWSESGPWAWQRGGALHFFGLDGRLEGVRDVDTVDALDVCPDGTVVSGQGRGSAASCGEAGRLWTECEAELCDVFRDDDWIGSSSPGSAVEWSDDVACWGDATLSRPEAGGATLCEDGRGFEGREGEHFSSSIAGNRAAGQFSKWLVPARARIVPLGEGTVWSVDRAAERSRVVISRADELWAIGIPGYLGSTGPVGRIYLIDEAGTEP